MTTEQLLRDLHDMAQHTTMPASKPVTAKARKTKKISRS